MAKRLIYRIEDADGRGAYKVVNKRWGDKGPYEFSGRHPTPDDDSRLRWDWLVGQWQYFFGFSSEEQMRAWFYDDRWMYVMQDLGLRLTVWEVDEEDSRLGNAQAIFKRDRAVLIETRDLI
jgi:hypothetical protein